MVLELSRYGEYAILIPIRNGIADELLNVRVYKHVI
jgi:hypothetical protein